MKHLRHACRHGAACAEGPAARDRADELGWIAAWQSARAPAALDRLLRAHAARIRAMARAWSTEAHRRDDLVSEGNLALICCLDGFVPREGVPFFAYARPFVRAAMRREVLRGAAVVAIPLQHLRAAREGRLGDRDLALLRGAARPQPIGDLEGWEPSAQEEPAEAAMIRAEEAEARRRLVDAALSRLSGTERLLVERCRGESDLPLAAVADWAGMSLEQARKIEGRALARMKAQFIRDGVTSARIGEEP